MEAKSEEGNVMKYQHPDIAKYLAADSSFMVLRVTPVEARINEGYYCIVEDKSAPDMTIDDVLRQYILGKDLEHAEKLRKGVEQEILGAYNSAASLLRDNSTLVHINGGPNNISRNDLVRTHLSLREEIEGKSVKPNSGVPILDIILEKHNKGGYLK